MGNKRRESAVRFVHGYADDESRADLGGKYPGHRGVVLGVELPIVSPDDLLIYKLIAGRPQDLADIDKLVRFGRAPVDEPRVRRWAREWEVEDRLDRALATARRDSP